MVRTTKQLRTAPGDKWAKIHTEIAKMAGNPATPGILVTGGTMQSAPVAGTPLATGFTTVLGMGFVVSSPVTPTMTAAVSATPLLNGNISVAASPAVLVSWIAFGI